ncbi:MAG: hypothetical protein LBC56_04095 [Oscillospiraceae bacterium]|nr:hypothetical protein [Oscillospiraceae bacterium]
MKKKLMGTSTVLNLMVSLAFFAVILGVFIRCSGELEGSFNVIMATLIFAVPSALMFYFALGKYGGRPLTDNIDVLLFFAFNTACLIKSFEFFLDFDLSRTEEYSTSVLLLMALILLAAMFVASIIFRLPERPPIVKYSLIFVFSSALIFFCLAIRGAAEDILFPALMESLSVSVLAFAAELINRFAARIKRTYWLTFVSVFMLALSTALERLLNSYYYIPTAKEYLSDIILPWYNILILVTACFAGAGYIFFSEKIYARADLMLLGGMAFEILLIKAVLNFDFQFNWLIPVAFTVIWIYFTASFAKNKQLENIKYFAYLCVFGLLALLSVMAIKYGYIESLIILLTGFVCVKYVPYLPFFKGWLKSAVFWQLILAYIIALIFSFPEFQKSYNIIPDKTVQYILVGAVPAFSSICMWMLNIRSKEKKYPWEQIFIAAVFAVLILIPVLREL